MCSGNFKFLCSCNAPPVSGPAQEATGWHVTKFLCCPDAPPCFRTRTVHCLINVARQSQENNSLKVCLDGDGSPLSKNFSFCNALLVHHFQIDILWLFQCWLNPEDKFEKLAVLWLSPQHFVGLRGVLWVVSLLPRLLLTLHSSSRSHIDWLACLGDKSHLLGRD